MQQTMEFATFTDFKRIPLSSRIIVSQKLETPDAYRERSQAIVGDVC